MNNYFEVKFSLKGSLIYLGSPWQEGCLTGCWRNREIAGSLIGQIKKFVLPIIFQIE